jgi:hypothetical protein
MGARKRTSMPKQDEVRQWVEKTRLAQGLSPQLTDPVVIAKLVEMLEVFRRYPMPPTDKHRRVSSR